MNHARMQALLGAIHTHHRVIDAELAHPDCARALIEAQAGRLLKDAAQLYAEACAVELTLTLEAPHAPTP